MYINIFIYVCSQGSCVVSNLMQGISMPARFKNGMVDSSAWLNVCCAHAAADCNAKLRRQTGAARKATCPTASCFQKRTRLRIIAQVGHRLWGHDMTPISSEERSPHWPNVRMGQRDLTPACFLSRFVPYVAQGAVPSNVAPGPMPS